LRFILAFVLRLKERQTMAEVIIETPQQAAQGEQHKGLLGTIENTLHPQPKPFALVITPTGATTLTTASTTVTVPKIGFWKSIEKWFAKLFGKAATWDAVALSVITAAAPIVVTIADLAGGPGAGAAVQQILNEIKMGLATAGTLIEDGQATPTLTSILTDIQNNLALIEKTVNIADPNSISALNAAVTLLTGEIQAIIAALPPSANLVLTSAA
jgi:hypothetical protein